MNPLCGGYKDKLPLYFMAMSRNEEFAYQMASNNFLLFSSTKFCTLTDNNVQGCRSKGDGGGMPSPPDFDTSFNPISTMVSNYVFRPSYGPATTSTKVVN